MERESRQKKTVSRGRPAVVDLRKPTPLHAAAFRHFIPQSHGRTSGMRFSRSTAQEALKDFGVGLEFAFARLRCKRYDDRVRREGAKEAGFEHEGEAVFVDADVVKRVVLAAQSRMRTFGEIVEALVHFGRQLGGADAFAFLLRLFGGLPQGCRPPRAGDRSCR